MAKIGLCVNNMFEIDNRRSVREFSEKEVEKEKILKILKAAMQAPSARNQQPWKFIVLKNRTVMKNLAEVLVNAKMLETCSFAILFLLDQENLKVPLMADQDMASCITLSLIEATSLQIGSCWCGIHPNQERVDNVRKVLNISKLIPFSVCCYGYPKDENALKFIDRFDSTKILNGDF